MAMALTESTQNTEQFWANDFWASSFWAEGFWSEAPVVREPPKQPPISVPGITNIIRQDHFQRKVPIEDTVVYSQLYQEDEEVIALVVSMIETGIIQ